MTSSHGFGSASAQIIEKTFTPPPPIGQEPKHIGWDLKVSATAGSSRIGAGGSGAAAALLIDDVQAFSTVDVREFLVAAVIVARVHGSLSSTGTGRADGQAYINAPDRLITDGSKPVAEFTSETSSNVNQKLTLGLLAPFELFATGITLEVFLGVGANSVDDSGTATADFANTMDIVSFDFLDHQGQPIDGITVVGSSGASYPVNQPFPVPEPGAILQLGSGLLVLVAFRRGRA